MSLNIERNYNSGNFFISGLLLLFIGLKLAKIIDWSWWWVLSPLWMVFAVGLVVLFLMSFFGGINGGKKGIDIVGEKP